MQLNRNDLRLFGLDLVAARDYLRAGWSEAMRWPLFAWLTPSGPVRFIRADGQEEIWQGGRRAAAAKNDAPPPFAALEIPEDRLLRRRLTLPAMPEAELAAAAALDARAASPFPAEDLLCGHAVAALPGGRCEVELVMASRAQADRFLQKMAQAASGAAPEKNTSELWAASSLPNQPPIIFPGYGETLRLKSAARSRRGVLALLALLSLLLCAIAVTPTAQLRARAIAAQHGYNVLHEQVQPSVRAREQLVAARERLDSAREILAARASVLPALDLVTRLLPDDTVLTRFEVQGSVVRLAGQTDNSANLMQALGSHPGLRDVRAPSAATRPPGAAKESFSLEFTVLPEAFAS